MSKYDIIPCDIAHHLLANFREEYGGAVMYNTISRWQCGIVQAQTFPTETN